MLRRYDMRTLRKGMSGNDVRLMQYKYILLGYELKADGDFGDITYRATGEFQKSRGLVVDYSVGPVTQKALGLEDYIVDIYSKNQVWFAGTPYDKNVKSYPVRTLRQWSELEPEADYLYNLAHYNMSKGIIGQTVVYLKAQGKDVGYGGTDEKILLRWQDVCAGYKVGIKDGKLLSLDKTKTAINANGLLKDGSYFHVQSVMDSTNYDLAKYMHDNYDVDLLLIQDGGGSVGKYDKIRDVHIAARMENSPNGRKVANVVCVKGEPINRTSITPPIPNKPEPLPPTKKFKVCLDAGHGVETNGKRSPDGTYLEYEFNLDMAYKMKEILERHNVEVILTRKDEKMLSKDSNTDLVKRVEIANSINDLSLFVSLHSNAYGDGTQWTSPRGYVIYTSAADDKAERNKAAKAILKRVKEAGILLRPTAHAHELFYVLRYTKAPAVLIEHGFHTNKEDVELLKADWYRNKLAIANCRGILDYLGIVWMGEKVEEEHWAKPALDRLVEKGIIVDAEQHKDLDAAITKGQLFVIIDKLTK